MLKSKNKGLFVDISEFSILAARTSGYKPPLVIEEVAAFSLEEDHSPADVRAFLSQLVDIKKGNYVANCGIYPNDRFIRYHEIESAPRLKNLNTLQKLLKSELKVDPESSSVSILNSHDGAQFNPSKNLTNQLIFCGAPIAVLQEVQDRILEYGLLPKRLELSSVATLGGICNYAQLNQIESSVMYIELDSGCSHIFIVNKGTIEMIRSLDFGLESIFPILQSEMELKDKASAKKLFNSNTFDVAEMGRKLLNKILNELQAIMGSYEVDTGLAIDRFYLGLLPAKLNWIANTISKALGLKLMQIDFKSWLQSLEIETGARLDLSKLGPRWFSVFSLIANFRSIEKVEE